MSRYPNVFAGKRIGVIVTGGNVAVESWARMVRAARSALI
jgi:hypothetical protein